MDAWKNLVTLKALFSDKPSQSIDSTFCAKPLSCSAAQLVTSYTAVYLSSTYLVRNSLQKHFEMGFAKYCGYAVYKTALPGRPSTPSVKSQYFFNLARLCGGVYSWHRH